MTSKLFVGGLSWNTNDEGLRAAFASYGEIQEAKVIMDRETGRSRGFGFVTFAEETGAKAALEMDGKPLDGRTLRVDLARDQQDRGSRDGGDRGGRYRGERSGGGRSYDRD